MAGGGVEVDTRRLQQGMRNLSSHLKSGGKEAAQVQAESTARTIASEVPVLTGRLQSSVGVVHEADGYGVSYGGPDVPYAWKIERRDHTVDNAVESARDEYVRRQHAVAEQAARRM